MLVPLRWSNKRSGYNSSWKPLPGAAHLSCLLPLFICFWRCVQQHQHLLGGTLPLQTAVTTLPPVNPA
ncbi:hypothetical protein XELAEV_18005500mg [Xenopus laevis]|uniref:Uncharacterized protein n=1 Tax=Xenopus laevis TaxID=8355 RepID=A0A974DYR7_XENLA|nr:hypothetical protein XELAEV_18005500mg [Xenopus laevis]